MRGRKWLHLVLEVMSMSRNLTIWLVHLKTRMSYWFTTSAAWWTRKNGLETRAAVILIYLNIIIQSRRFATYMLKESGYFVTWPLCCSVLPLTVVTAFTIIFQHFYLSYAAMMTAIPSFDLTILACILSNSTILWPSTFRAQSHHIFK